MDEAAACVAATCPDSSRRLWHTAFLIVVGLTLLRLGFLLISPLELDVEEAQYWSWAANPAWGYFSKPPLIAWLIGLTTSICGDGPACVRLASPLMHGATALVLGACGLALGGRRLGAWSAIVYATLPGVAFSAMLITTDVPLMFFWAISLYAFIRMRQGGGLDWAVMGGLAAGLGVLSKYAMLFFFVGILIYLVLSPQGRRAIGWRGPALMFGLSLAFLLPNVLWNLTHGWITIEHTKDLAERAPRGFRPDKVFVEFIGGQIAIFGPVMLYLLLREGATWRRGSTERATPGSFLAGDQRLLLLCLSLPFFLPFLVLSVASHANANWTAYAYLAGCILVAAKVADRLAFRWLRGAVVAHVAVGFAMYAFLVFPPLWPAAPAGLRHTLEHMTGWQALGKIVAGELAKDPAVRLLAPENRGLTALLLYYARIRPNGYVAWNDDGIPDSQYELVASLVSGDRGPLLLVGQRVSPMVSRFDSVLYVGSVTIPLFGGQSRQFDLYRLAGFRGYLQ